MELARSTQWLEDLWSFGFPKMGLKVNLSFLKASPQHARFLEITGPVKVS